MTISAIGSILILCGLAVLMMALINYLSNSLPPRCQKIELLKKKKSEGISLSKEECLEANQVDFEEKLPAIGFLCLLVGFVLIFTK